MPLRTENKTVVNLGQSMVLELVFSARTDSLDQRVINRVLGSSESWLGILISQPVGTRTSSKAPLQSCFDKQNSGGPLEAKQAWKTAVNQPVPGVVWDQKRLPPPNSLLHSQSAHIASATGVLVVKPLPSTWQDWHQLSLTIKLVLRILVWDLIGDIYQSWANKIGKTIGPLSLVRLKSCDSCLHENAW